MNAARLEVPEQPAADGKMSRADWAFVDYAWKAENFARVHGDRSSYIQTQVDFAAGYSAGRRATWRGRVGMVIGWTMTALASIQIVTHWVHW